MTTDLLLPARFNGPPGSGNGGFAAGTLAEHLSTHSADAHGHPHAPLGVTVEVTLRRPPPLDTPLAASVAGERAVLGPAAEPVAEARLVELDLAPVPEVPPEAAARAMQGYPSRSRHPFPTCFGCGPDRAEGDGLRIFPGPVGADRGLVASVWLPQPGHAETSDLVDAVQRCGVATTWTALDCVGGWSEDLEARPCVLGRMTARVDALPVVGEAHVVVGRLLGREGRKSFTASTLYDADDRVVATARHTWLQVDPATFG